MHTQNVEIRLVHDAILTQRGSRSGRQQMQRENPYEKCPVYETEKFVFRLVQEGDAQDLLECYSDPASAKLFNSDNCTSNFIYQTIAEMKNCIRFWLDEYKRRCYIRFSIVDKNQKKAVGTIECFAKQERFQEFGTVGVLRVDIASQYENKDVITEILNMVGNHFYDCFVIESIITKAVPEAKQRVIALKNTGYQELKNNPIMPFADYYVSVR